MSKGSQNMRGTLCHWQARHFMQDIAARTVPLLKPTVNALDPRERVISFGIRGVDILPGWKNEYGGVKRVGRERSRKRCRGQRRGFVKHAKRLDQTPVEENPGGLRRVSVKLLGVTTKNLAGKFHGLGAWSLAARQALRNDCPG